MKATDARQTTGIPLSAIARDARALDLAAFVRRYAKVFFVRHGAVSSRASPSDGEVTGEITLFAMPVKKQPTSVEAFVGVGRLEGCDIAILDETVSKLHAYVEERPEDVWLLQDAGSRNGTTVDGHPVSARGNGPPTTLKVGQTVRFGSVTTTFMDAAGLAELAKKVTRA